VNNAAPRRTVLHHGPDGAWAQKKSGAAKKGGITPALSFAVKLLSAL